MNQSGTGSAGTSSGEYIDTEDSFDITTEDGYSLIVDSATSSIKQTTVWDAASKSAQAWRTDGYSRAVNYGSAQERCTEDSDSRITEDGNVRIVEDAYELLKPLTEWTES
jgi:hypothetical protein